MRRTDFLPRDDAALEQWLENFATVCVELRASLGLSEEEVATVLEESNGFKESMRAVVQAKAAYLGAVAGKNSQRSEASQTIRSLARRLKANPIASPEALRQLGILHKSSEGPVRTVKELTVVGNSNGINLLQWNRNQNSARTTFIVECAQGLSDVWEIVDVTSTTRFEHRDQTPGVFLRYRVRSIRAGKSSPPTDPVSIYSDGQPSSLLRSA